MAEKETVFSSKMIYNGIFPFSDFYNFCYGWLTEDLGFYVTEDKYTEKLDGNSKGITIKWAGSKEVTDYFKFSILIFFRIIGLTKVEITKDGKKEKTNKGSVEIKMVGDLVRDYKGKFEKTAFQKFLRSIYEKWVIPSRIEEYEGKLATECESFLTQAKAFLDLEGKK